MQLVSTLAGAGFFTQATDLARGLKAEWRRLYAWVESHLDALAERQRTIDKHVMPVRVLRALNDRLGTLLDRALDSTRVEQIVQRREPEAERMTKELEWALATQEFYSAPGAAERAVACQETAALQIDAAAYALDDVLDELRGVMSVRARDNVFAHQADYTEQYGETLFAAAVKVAVSEIDVPRHIVAQHRQAA